MSRHRKVKAMNYDDEYDDYYGAMEEEDEDFDLDENDFESKYLSSGIDLKIDESSNNNKENKLTREPSILQHQQIADKPIANKSVSIASQSTIYTQSNTNDNVLLRNDDEFGKNRGIAHTPDSTDANLTTQVPLHGVSTPVHRIETIDQKIRQTNTGSSSNITPELTKIAVQHLDRFQWQLPLLDMDQKFRDRTYYKHYSDHYITSLRSKLGHFLADNQMIANPMSYHMKRELDNYQKYNEEIAIGCRFGTKAPRKQPQPKEKSLAKVEQKTARFEYSGNKSKRQQKDTVDKSALKTPTPSTGVKTRLDPVVAPHELTIQETHTAEQLNRIAEKHKETLRVNDTKVGSAKVKISNSLLTTCKKSSIDPIPRNSSASQKSNKLNVNQKQIKPLTAKPLATLGEKRKSLKEKLKQNSEPSAQDLKAFEVRALQVTQEYNEIMKGSRARLNLVVVGHVDAGKSTLVGHLLYKLGHITNKQMHRYEVDSKRSGKSSFKFAWAMDETGEERARGVTIDIALTKFETPHRDIVILDAPGHVDFIPAVISGAAQADAALLVVDATKGEFETGFELGGQTREHTFLVRSLGVKSLVVVINKMDNVDWNPHRYNDIVEQLRPFIKQAGFNLKDDVQFVAVSGLTGENLLERRVDKQRKQSSHPQLEQSSSQQLDQSLALIEAIDSMKLPDRMVDKPTRLCVTDIFKGMSSGVHLAGKLVSGRIEPKQKMILLPPMETCEVKSIEASSSSSNKAFAGDLITLTCNGIDMAKYYRGCMLCDPVLPCSVTNRFQARIIMFQNANTILLKGTPIEVHINGTYESGSVRKLLSLLNKNSGELIQKRPRCIAQNASAVIQLRLERVVCCELYENNKDLGRFMMRSYGKTIAAGLITKIKQARVRKSSGTKMKSKG